MKCFRQTCGRLALAVALAGLASVPLDARAAGLLIADGGLGGVLEIKEHDVQVTVNNGIAVTRITQIFHNTERRQVEALYTFPVPKGASVSGFSMWINGKEMVGEVLEKKRAREIYESYKQVRKDPGLLEQVDYRTFEMRIFPIGPEADQKVELTYYQELDYDNDAATYVYPLATVTRQGVDSRTTGKFAFSFEVKSAIPITAVDSPSHDKAFVVAKHSDTFWQANLETTGGSLARDIVLAHHISRPVTGMDLLTSKRPGEDGYFCLTLTAGEDTAAQNDGMDYVFVLDASGSMADDGKLLVSKDAVNAFLNELAPGDRFEVMAFNVQPSLAFQNLTPATPEARQQAQAYLASQQARGGTILHPALTVAFKYASPDRPLNVIILSDGLTEQQERAGLLQQIKAGPRNARVFCIGVGNDVNRPLLEQLAEDSGGLAAFVSAGDNFERQARAFRRKLLRPVATSLVLDIAGVEVTDLEPKLLPNLYHGTPVRLYGRYRGNGPASVTLRGSVNGLELKKTAQLEFPKTDDTNPEINRLWAWRRVDRLQKEADRTGSRNQVVGEIIRLGEDFSIATEYTSFLVLENDAEYQRWKIERRNLDRLGRDRQALDKRRQQLDAIRQKALDNLGPQAQKVAPAQPSPQQMASLPPNMTAPQPAPTRAKPSSRQADSSPASRQSFDFSIGGGSGPVGPLGVGFILWMLRRKQRHA